MKPSGVRRGRKTWARWGGFLVGAWLCAVGAGRVESASAPSPAVVDSNAVVADTSYAFRLEIGNRMFPDWHEDRRARLQQPFVIGDTENSAVVTKLLPDFRIVDGRPKSISKSMNNPAVRVMVYKGETAVDSSWAFLNFPPHFSAHEFYTFRLQEITDPQGKVVSKLAPTDGGAAAPTGAAAKHGSSKRGEGSKKPAAPKPGTGTKGGSSPSPEE